MRLALFSVLVLVAVAFADEKADAVAAPLEEAPVDAALKSKTARADYQTRPITRAQNRDGDHHHHHHHEPAYAAAPAAPAYADPAPAPAPIYAPAPAPVYAPAPAPVYVPAPPEPAPAAYAAEPAAAPAYAPEPAAPAYAPEPAAAPAPAPAYSTPGHQGYYYYYYPVKDSKVKLKLPKLPKLPKINFPKLPQYYAKEGSGLSMLRSIGSGVGIVTILGGIIAAVMPVLGLGLGARSLSSMWESEIFSRANLNVAAEYVLDIIENYQQRFHH